MLFNSLNFLIFFPVVTATYFLLPHKYRWFLLLAASCYFYMCFIPAFILILGFTITIDYFAGLFIERATGKKKKLYLIASIIANIGVLFVFKYFNFFNANVAALASFLHWNYSLESLSLILPIGLSFHTFQSLAYTVEVYRGNQPAEKNYGIFALYVMFYPQLVAGPIERPQNLIHQFYEKHYFDFVRIADGLKLMLWGFFKKVVIADRLSLFVNQVYGNVYDYGGFQFVIATIFFAWQIYCDFSGYSDIAIGAAKVMGFKLMENFRQPYFSKSISEFWHRWHISLSSWFKDYLYIPLGGNRVGAKRYYFNLMITFLLSGIWHGANWTYVVWGALNGFYLVFSAITTNFRGRLINITGINRLPLLYKMIQITSTFILVCIGWVFFRANNISDAFYIIKTIFGKWSFNLNFGGVGKAHLIIAVFSILLLELIQLIQKKTNNNLFINEKTLIIRWGAYFAMILLILFFGVFENVQFIYFQF